MIVGVLAAACVGTNRLSEAAQFYQRLFAIIGWALLQRNEHEAGFGRLNAEAEFWVLTPYDREPATVGNGSQVMFRLATPEQVNEFHSAALAQGGSDDGAPGPRDYRPGYYGAYVRDLDGNKLHAFCITND